MTTHELKTWPSPFQSVLDGSKRAEFRLADRQQFQVGDVLHLREYRPFERWPEAIIIDGHSEGYTGRELTCVVTHIVKGGHFGIPAGYVMMSISDVKVVKDI